MERLGNTDPLTLHGLFLRASAAFASNPAVVFDDGAVSRVVDYGTLATHSGVLACKLRQHGVGSNKLVAICGTQPDEVVIAILGILQVPAAFTFIAPDAPVRRTVTLLSQLRVSLLITTQQTVEEGKLTNLKASFHLSTEAVDISEGSSLVFVSLDPLNDQKTDVPMVMPDPLAYVVSTSGTTGPPKIVRVPHRCIVPNITHLRRIFDVSPPDIIFNASPLTFDPSIVEIFLALSTGATLVTVPDEMRRTPNKILSALIRHGVSILQVTPSFLLRISSDRTSATILSSCTQLRILAFGGEPCPSLAKLSPWIGTNNRTEIYNLYGITEVSSWASYHHLDGGLISTECIPLGQPLSETILEVWDENGAVISEGEGRLHIGSSTRVCVIDDECHPADKSIVFRDSGDYVRFAPSGLMFLGRKDDQLKRFGKRFNLREVKMALESFPEVAQCEVSVDKSLDPVRLYAFYIPVSGTDFGERIRVTEAGHRLESQLQDHLPEPCIPDHLFRVGTFPLTNHGKLDGRRLTQWARDHLTGRSVSRSRGDLTLEDWQRQIEDHLKSVLLLKDSPERQKTFVELGGNSIQAVTLVERLEQWFGRTDPGLLDSILHCCLGDVMDSLTSELSLPVRKSMADTGNGKIGTAAGTRNEAPSGLPKEETHGEDMGPKSDPRRGIVELLPTGNSDKGESSTREVIQKNVRRDSQADILDDASQCSSGNAQTKRKRGNEDVADHHLEEGVRITQRGDCVYGRGSVPLVATKTQGQPHQQVVLCQDWRVDLEKCIDASPLVVMDKRLPHAVVFIGSHSGIFVAIDTVTSRRLWQVRLPDRIESSAGLSPCKRFVVVGCYDNNVYFLDRHDGTEHWSFWTNGMVKSSPVASADTGLVYVGSHDGRIYALDAATKTCRFSADVGGGSVFSSPCIDPSIEAVYAGSLSGYILCISWMSGNVNWSYRCPKPLFSSPTVVSTGVVIGCVDGGVYSFSHTGQLIYSISTEAPIFSSPCKVSNALREETILIGSHDGHIYCLTNGSIRWRTKIGKHVYSTPSYIFPSGPKQEACVHSSRKKCNSCRFCGSPVSEKEVLTGPPTGDLYGRMPGIDQTEGLVGCCSTDGVFVTLDLATGEVLSSYQLPGELFSSPVFMEDGRVIVACRDDNLYCFSLGS